MIFLKPLLVLYISCMLLWSLILIWYLNRALVAQRQPNWLRTIIQSGQSSEFILYGSVMLSPAFILLGSALILKRIIGGKL